MRVAERAPMARAAGAQVGWKTGECDAFVATPSACFGKEVQ